MYKLFTFLILFFLCHLTTYGQEDIGAAISTEREGESDTTRMSEKDIMAETEFVNAVNLRIAGKYKDAITVLERLIKSDDSNAAYFYELSRNQLLDNQTDFAAISASRAVSMDADNRWYRIFEAEVQEKAGNNGRAAELYEEIVARYPRVEEYWLKLSQLYHLTNDTRKAADTFDRMAAIFGNTEEILFRKFQALVELDKISEATETLELLVNLNPHNLSLKNTLASFYKNHGREEEGMSLFREVLEADPSNTRANLALASEMKENNEDDRYITSIMSLLENKDIEIDAKIGELMPYLQKYINRRDTTLTIPFMNAGKALVKSHAKEPKAWSIAGDIAFHAGEYNLALENYDAALQLTKGVYSIFEQKMLILLYQKKYRELLNFSNEVLDLYPNQLTTYFHLAYAQLKTGDPAGASASLQTMSLMTGKKHPFAARIAALQSVAYTAMNDKNNAEKQLRQADELSTNAMSANQVAGVLAEFNIAPDLALHKITLANEKDPDNPFNEMTLSLLYFKAKDMARAKQWIEKALTHGGAKFPAITELAGDVYFMAKDLTRALDMWQKTKEMGVVSPVLEKKLAEKTYFEKAGM